MGLVRRRFTKMTPGGASNVSSSSEDCSTTTTGSACLDAFFLPFGFGTDSADFTSAGGGTAGGTAGGGDAHAASGAAAAPALLRFRCGLPVTLLADEAAAGWSADELQRLRELRRACPAYFARRGHRRHQLDWLHRRRVVRSDAPGCADLAEDEDAEGSIG